MMGIPPRYCQGFVDRHGKARWYYRRTGFNRVALPGLPWSPEFMAAYEAAQRGETPPDEGKTEPGTVAALVVSYYRSTDYRNLKPITQRTYRGVIERFRQEHRDKRVATIRREHVKAILSKLSDRPAVANNWLKTPALCSK